MIADVHDVPKLVLGPGNIERRDVDDPLTGQRVTDPDTVLMAARFAVIAKPFLAGIEAVVAAILPGRHAAAHHQRRPLSFLGEDAKADGVRLAPNVETQDGGRVVRELEGKPAVLLRNIGCGVR